MAGCEGGRPPAPVQAGFLRRRVHGPAVGLGSDAWPLPCLPRSPQGRTRPLPLLPHPLGNEPREAHSRLAPLSPRPEQPRDSRPVRTVMTARPYIRISRQDEAAILENQRREVKDYTARLGIPDAA